MISITRAAILICVISVALSAKDNWQNKKLLYCDSAINNEVFNFIIDNPEYADNQFFEKVSYSVLDSILNVKRFRRIRIQSKNTMKQYSSRYWKLKDRNIELRDTAIALDDMQRIILMSRGSFKGSMKLGIGMLMTMASGMALLEATDYAIGHDFEPIQIAIIAGAYSAAGFVLGAVFGDSEVIEFEFISHISVSEEQVSDKWHGRRKRIR